MSETFLSRWMPEIGAALGLSLGVLGHFVNATRAKPAGWVLIVYSAIAVCVAGYTRYQVGYHQ